MTEQKKTPEDEYPRFISTIGQPVLLSVIAGGHSVSVQTKEGSDGKGTPLHPRFHRIAVMRGCMPLGMESSPQAEQAGTVHHDRERLILSAISDMVAQSADDPAKQVEMFTNDGRPDARQLAVRLGFPVTADERDRAWDKYAGEETESED